MWCKQLLTKGKKNVADLLVHRLLAWHVRLLGGHIWVLSWQCRNHVLHAVWLVAHVTHTVSWGRLGHGRHSLGLRDHVLQRIATSLSVIIVFT